VHEDFVLREEENMLEAYKYSLSYLQKLTMKITSEED
jgi:hypothetical protein